MPRWTLYFPFWWQQSTLTYLGITISKSPALIHKNNMTTYITSLECTLSNWCNLPLSYVGRAHLIKMVEFPWLLYLLNSFQSTYAWEGTLYHCLWQCPMIQTFWNKFRLLTNTHLTNYILFNPTWRSLVTLTQMTLLAPQERKTFICGISCRNEKHS